MSQTQLCPPHISEYYLRYLISWSPLLLSSSWLWMMPKLQALRYSNAKSSAWIHIYHIFIYMQVALYLLGISRIYNLPSFLINAFKKCDVGNNAFVILEVQFHHEGGLSGSRYLELFSRQGLYFHHTKNQPPLRPPSTFSEHWPWFWQYLLSEKFTKEVWYKIWVITI